MLSGSFFSRFCLDSGPFRAVVRGPGVLLAGVRCPGGGVRAWLRLAGAVQAVGLRVMAFRGPGVQAGGSLPGAMRPGGQAVQAVGSMSAGGASGQVVRGLGRPDRV